MWKWLQIFFQRGYLDSFYFRELCDTLRKDVYLYGVFWCKKEKSNFTWEIIYQTGLIYEHRGGNKTDLTMLWTCDIPGHMVLPSGFPEWDIQNFFLFFSSPPQVLANHVCFINFHYLYNSNTFLIPLEYLIITYKIKQKTRTLELDKRMHENQRLISSFTYSGVP